jgi:TPP-dependent pyruvate/acetoin dehydrogenase alpha subunit
MSSESACVRLELMLRARRFDETLLAHREYVDGPSPVGIGQEGTAAAIATSRQPGDTLSLNHRNHHHLLAGGADPEVCYREIFGRDGGPQRGLSGTLHLIDPDHGIQHTSAMVGMSVPLAVGAALAHHRRGGDRIAFATCGDGALSEGVTSESFNLAVLWRLPVVFVCESNAEPVGEQATPILAARRIVDIPAAHRVGVEEADATNPRQIADAIERAAAFARAGGGPRFVLAQTVPWPGNLTFLPQPLPPLDLSLAVRQSSGWELADPIVAEARALIDDGVPMTTLLSLDAQITAGMQAAVREAAAAPAAPGSVALEHVLGVR